MGLIVNVSNQNWRPLLFLQKYSSSTFLSRFPSQQAGILQKLYFVLWFILLYKLAEFYEISQLNEDNPYWVIAGRHGSREKYFGGGAVPPVLQIESKSRRRENQGTEWGWVCWGVFPPQSTRGLGSVVSSPNKVWGRAQAGNAILAYFEGLRTLFFAPICWCFEFIKQCSMLHLGARPSLGGNCPLTQRRTAPDCRKFIAKR